ncbi:hypothetical protein [Cellulomonas sp. ATA003]|uniref:hypothetical protein n=1 Tax=Cellulomonas sp. ATA003 TaxID=3073064 RepID=UPI002873A8C0|nr:hypothetical protein [Cellulomonas sp. ATA003]WNB85418.1 hypothetical protein REH70_17840 [Cellulomonas sp. ATA003]
MQDRVPLERHGAIALGAPTLLVFGAFAAAQLYMRVTGPDAGLVETFGLDGEQNVPAFWNTVLLLSIGAVALLIGELTPAGRTPSRGVWRLAAVATAYLAMDEALSIHELLGGPASAAVESVGLDLPIYTWVLPGLVLAAVGVLLAVRWFRAVPRDVRLGLVVAGGAYLLGALVIETLNGALLTAGHDSLYALSTAVEELLEMSGCVIAVCVLLRLVDLDPSTRAMALRQECAPRPAQLH